METQLTIGIRCFYSFRITIYTQFTYTRTNTLHTYTPQTHTNTQFTHTDAHVQTCNYCFYYCITIFEYIHWFVANDGFICSTFSRHVKGKQIYHSTLCFMAFTDTFTAVTFSSFCMNNMWIGTVIVWIRQVLIILIIILLQTIFNYSSLEFYYYNVYTFYKNNRFGISKPLIN